MATSDNRFKQGLDLDQWLALFGPLIQFKVDKPGGVLPPEASNTRAIAEWFNTVDDLMLAVVDGSVGGQAFEETRGTCGADEEGELLSTPLSPSRSARLAWNANRPGSWIPFRSAASPSSHKAGSRGRGSRMASETWTSC